MRKLWIMAVLVGVMLLSACTQPAPPAATPAPTTPAPTAAPLKPTGAVKEIELTLSIKGFAPANPARYEVTQGDKVRFKVTATDEEHNFVIDEYNIKKTIKKGETATIEFLADKVAVQIPFYDDKPGHRYQENGQLAVRPQYAAPTGAVKEIPLNISIKGFAPANPARWEVNQGDLVRFKVTNVDTDVDHNFVIDEYSIYKTIKPGQTVTVEFLADIARYQIPVYDDLKGHRYQENGQLVVNPVPTK